MAPISAVRLSVVEDSTVTKFPAMQWTHESLVVCTRVPSIGYLPCRCAIFHIWEVRHAVTHSDCSQSS